MRALAALAMLGLAACPRGPVQFGPDGEVKSAKAMLAILAKHDARFVTMQGEVKLKVESAQASGTVSQYIAVTRPAGLHIETFNFFGKPVSVLVSDGDRFSLYDAEKNIFYVGPATAESMARFLPVALAPEEAVALILGQVPRIPAPDGVLILNTEKRRYELTLQVGPVKQILYIEPRDLNVTRSMVTGADAYDLTLDDYRNEPGGPFPHQLRLDAQASNVSLTFKYGDVHINDSPDLSMFRMDAPASARVVELDASGHSAVIAPDGGS